MLDPLMTLLAAKVKAVGLVAGTALVTSALVGGGAVAMTAVGHDTALESSSAEQAPVTTASPSAAVVEASGKRAAGAAPSPLPGQVDSDSDRLDDVSGLPLGFACDDAKNHGQNVSAFAHSLPKGPGRGQLVSAVAQSDCGKAQAEAEAEASASPEPTTTKAPKPAKAAKPAKAGKPAKHEPAKAHQRGAHKPASQQRGAGKGGGKD